MARPRRPKRAAPSRAACRHRHGRRRLPRRSAGHPLAGRRRPGRGAASLDRRQRRPHRARRDDAGEPRPHRPAADGRPAGTRHLRPGVGRCAPAHGGALHGRGLFPRPRLRRPPVGSRLPGVRHRLCLHSHRAAGRRAGMIQIKSSLCQRNEGSCPVMKTWWHTSCWAESGGAG
ncbi:hypothetical protein KL86PLE_41329 [uncultured Pleomorphomonas sp.]|uniref:Uncharacterized protein n=1 Tax=uncultured Pleomorphomonas sp. TaxID=442121 RepID=A0A212LJ12_9HYPH|nr:hypothetical protein KL86PLE_41329 [uncultured Pleomorphomonas sp.]